MIMYTKFVLITIRIVSNYLFFSLAFLIMLIHSQEANAQKLTYEELTSIEMAQIYNVFLSPKGTLFATSRHNLYRSDDEGRSWRIIRSPQVGHYTNIFQIKYFSDGTSVLCVSEHAASTNAFIFRDGNWQTIFPSYTFYNPDVLKIVDDVMYHYFQDSLMVSNNRGRSFEKIADYSSDNKVRNLFFSDDLIILNKSSLDTLSGEKRAWLDIYDMDFNHIKTQELDKFVLDDYNHVRMVTDEFGNIVAYGRERNHVFYSTDLGESFVFKDLQNDKIEKYYSWISGCYLYYRNIEDKLARIKLDINFKDNPIEIFIDESYERYLVHNEHILHNNEYEIAVTEIDTKSSYTIDRIPFPDIEIEEIKFDSRGGIYARTNRLLFYLDDDNSEWKIIYTSERFISDLAIRGDKVYVSDSRIGLIEISDQSVNTNFMHKFHLDSIFKYPFYHYSEKDDMEFILSSSHSQGAILSVSENGGPFVHSDTLDFDILPAIGDDDDFRFTSYNGKLYVTTDGLGGIVFSNEIFFSIDYENAFRLSEERFLGGNDVRYTSYVFDNGEVFVHPGEKTREGPVSFFPTFYSSNIEESLEPAGRGPKGKLLKSNNVPGTFVIPNNGDHYYRSHPEENYAKVDIINQPFDHCDYATVDNEGRLLLTANFGSIYRSDPSGVKTFVEEPDVTAFAINPNPAQEILNIQTKELGGFDYVLLDVNGKIVSRGACDANQVQGVCIDHLDQGIYFISIMQNDIHQGTLKFVKL